MDDHEAKKYDGYVHESKSTDIHHGVVHDNADDLQRRLGNRQIQLIAIGGSIGTALFVSIGGALNKGGPLGMLLAYFFYSCLLGLVNNCMAEMATFMPVTGGFIRMAGHWVDEAFGFMVGWNFFFYEALLIPFEITALNLVLTYWRDDIPVAAVCAGCIVLYAYEPHSLCPEATAPTANFRAKRFLGYAISSPSGLTVKQSFGYPVARSS